MSATKPEIKRIELPLAKGLSQKEDPLWLQPGSSQTATNLVATKAGALRKKLGTNLLNSNGFYSSAATIGQTQPQLLSGTRLLKHNDNLHILGAEGSNNTLGVWSYDDRLAAPTLLDRVPEVYVPPTQPEATLPLNAIEMDEVVSSGYRLTVVLFQTTPTSFSVLYQVKDAQTGQVVVPLQALISLSQDVPMKLVLCGTIAVLITIGGAPIANIQAAAIDLSAPQNGWGAFVALTNSAVSLAMFDVSAVAGDTTRFLVVYDNNVLAQHALIAQKGIVTAGLTPTVATDGAAVTLVDAVYTPDNKPLDGVCVRADATNGYAYLAYAYHLGGLVNTQAKVRAQSITWPGLAARNPAFSIITYTPPNINTITPVIRLMDIAKVSGVVGHAEAHMVCFSPAQQWLGAAYTDPSTQITWGQFIACGLIDNASGSILGNVSTTWGVTLASRIIPNINGIGYVVGYLNSVLQGSFFLLAIDRWAATTGNSIPLRDVAHLGPRLASGQVQALGPYQDNTTNGGSATPPTGFVGTQGLGGNTVATSGHGVFASHFTLPHVVQNTYAPGGNVWETVLVRNQTSGLSAPTVYQFDLAPTLIGNAGQLGEDAIVAAGSPFGFDGVNAFGLAFPHYPEVASVTESTVATGSFVQGDQYNYIVVYEQRDARGQLHRSARSAPYTHTVAGAAVKGLVVSVAIAGFSDRVKTVGLDAKSNLYPFPASSSPIIVKLYRSMTSTNGAGKQVPISPTVYHNVDSIEIAAGDATTIAQVNSPTNGFASVALTDILAPSKLGANSLLYGDGSDGSQPGNILDNLCAPAFQAMVTHKNRIWGADGNNIWLSKALTPFEGPGFNEATAFSVDDGPLGITALASMDDKLIIFKNDRIFYMTGEGPADNGLENDLTPPTRIPSDVGCVDWRSVVVFSKGTWFLSANGLYLLTRDLQILPAGKNVEDTLSTYPIVTSATVNTSTGEVRWTACTDDVSNPRNGVVIVYNYVLDVWTTETHVNTVLGTVVNHGALSAITTKTGTSNPRVDSYQLLEPNGTVQREVAGVYKDFTLFTPLVWESPWIKADRKSVV